MILNGDRLADSSIEVSNVSQFARVPFSKLLEEFCGTRVAIGNQSLLSNIFVVNQQAFLSPVVVKFVEDVFDLSARDLNSKVLCGNRFEGMRFVKNGRMVFRQQADSMLP